MVIDNLDDLLPGGDAFQHLSAECFGLGFIDKLLDHRQCHIGFKQRHAHLAHGRRDIALGETAMARQLVEGGA